METLRVARAAECKGYLRSKDWPHLAVALMLEDVGDAEVAELAGLDRQVSARTVDPLTEALYERHGVPLPDPESAVGSLAGLMAADLRASGCHWIVGRSGRTRASELSGGRRGCAGADGW